MPLFLSVMLLGWVLSGIAITGSAALNGAMLLLPLRLLALGALLLAGEHNPSQPVLRASWWLAALSLCALPFFPLFSGAWLITNGAIAAGPAWVGAVGVGWLVLLLLTLALLRAGGREPVHEARAAPVEAAAGPSVAHAPTLAELGANVLLLVLAMLLGIVGVAPEAAVSLFTGAAAAAVPVSGGAQAGVQATPVGLVTPAGAWLPGIFWVLLVTLLLLRRLLGQMTTSANHLRSAAVPPFLGGEIVTASSEPAHEE
jgi:formate hydrogenlyase subunit 3/multisubunit Na+/H+ antiporter MnhD subunit